MGSSDSVTVIVLAWNQVEATVSCLRSLVDAHCGDWSLDILLVDNGSTDLRYAVTNAIRKLAAASNPATARLGSRAT